MSGIEVSVASFLLVVVVRAGLGAATLVPCAEDAGEAPVEAAG